MADNTKIEWTDATWNPITGCSVVSPGCTNCYAMRLAGTRLKHHWSRKGLTTDTKAGPVWNGTARFNAPWIDQPLRWTKPRMIFVCAHGDLFHEDAPDLWIDQVFAVMALCPKHTFQVLTKRPERMRDYMTRPGKGYDGKWIESPGMGARDGIRREMVNMGLYEGLDDWPLPNVWLGVSVEDQTRADERIPILLDTPAAVRWISAEPLLGPVDLEYCESPYERHSGWPGTYAPLIGSWWPAVGNPQEEFEGREEDLARIDWVVAGGESGPNARPMHPDWARSLRDQCAAAGVPFHFKQHGAWVAFGDPNIDYKESQEAVFMGADGTIDRRFQIDVMEAPHRCQQMNRVGKKRAGRLLDGVEHNGYPEIAA